MVKKYYAVKQGRETGIFEDWLSCERQVKGFPGASYKSFKNIDDAKLYLASESKLHKNTISDRIYYPCAFVDGSYDSLTKRYSYGAVVMESENSEYTFSEKFENNPDAEMRNVAGEIQGSIFAIKYAQEHDWPEIHIYYDYLGIEKWATGEWKRNLNATKAYYDFCQEASKNTNIYFVKVKGHSGNKYNDKADHLARSALNL